MRIHRLEIEAFGPFAGLEAIDFDQLGSHGLFLLNGPTGAGKTSVLDAICFALYGSVPGARQDGKRLRSDHAAPSAEPRVLCEFSARGRRFEVTRSPAWERPSARGSSGFTTQKAKTLLRERVDGAWIEKSGRNDEAGGEITALLGMDREQFTRVVMLPQGDFAAFLRAKAADRLDLLQKLFGTQRFESIEQQLSREAAEARNDVADHEARLRLLANQAEAEFAALDLAKAESAEHDLPTQHDLPTLSGGLSTLSGAGPDSTEELLKTFRDAAAAEAERRRAEAEDVASDTQRLARRFQSEQEKAGRHLKLAAATDRRAALTAAEPAVASSRRRLDRHRQALMLRGQLAAVDAAGEKSAAAEARLKAAAFALAGKIPGAAEPAVLLTAVTEDIAVLEARIPDERKLEDLVARIGKLEAEAVRNSAHRERSAAALKEIQLSENRLATVINSLEGRAGGLAEAERAAADARLIIDAVARYGQAREAEKAVELGHLEAKEHSQSLRQEWLDFREARLANAAADLAALLEEGMPCPVCGSAEHPQPAGAAGDGLAIAEEEQRAREAFDASSDEVEQLARELSEARQLVALLAGKGGSADAAEASEAGRRAQAAVEAARFASEELARILTERTRLAEEAASLNEQLIRLEAESLQTSSLLAALSEQRDALDAQLSALRCGYPSLRHRVGALHVDKLLLQETVQAAENVQRAADSLAEAESGLLESLPAAGFASVEEARAVLLPEDEARALEHDIASHASEAARVEELFSSEDLGLAAKEVEVGELPLAAQELEDLRRSVSAKEDESRRLYVATALADKAGSRLAEIMDKYVATAEEGRKPRERAELLSQLAETARGSGENSYRMSLNSYVLAARLEQVALAASERLVAMSDGRYTLQHSDAKAARGARSGLGLQVLDGWTGQLRDTSTLSGGESFMASLSLALGLADVVQQEAGGIDIETLFVDEGFGSLDEQALEQVMDALEGLRDGGRVVGLVSHVGEMKQRIGAQLQVIKGRHGSSVRVSEAVPA
ncbi:AAA family ATPase [Arthrobacter sp. ISL-30]|uniref:AAA family ATPase n=1 Tax=Arthrobacter sp. ISL-30 TaxID=2819109 RepID=UPI001BE5EC81|nr:SMC family ATPase [Arthrobacter sp. ISL-30]MBT2513997.1 SMC family ATPase [Arthrobacter sp. ISL-30]